jgi:sialate O-acetylesterase
VIPVNCGYANTAPDYAIDNSAEAGSFSQIAYLLELQKGQGEIKYAFTSMDAFTDDVKKIGIPTVDSGARFMQQVANLTVRSNVDGIETVTASDGGNIEFWPGNYGGLNQKQIPGADDKLFDFGDQPSDKIPGYSCMQVHNWKSQQTVFAFNKWNSGPVDLGIGNSTGKTRDWTFLKNGGDYTLRRLTVLVK